MQGKTFMDSTSLSIAGFITAAYGIRPINIIYQLQGRDKKATVTVCLELDHQYREFFDDTAVRYDVNKQQQIAEKLRELTGYPGEVWVYYSTFAPIARTEANGKITEREIQQLQKKLNISELWIISRVFDSATFFLFTDEQVKHVENSRERKVWAERYLELLKPYDEFNYFQRDRFNISLDSKENFDNNYQSNWFYYYK